MAYGDFDIETVTDPEVMRDNVLDAVKELEVRPYELIVVGGAALQVFGIKVSPDIDVVVPPSRMREIITDVETFKSPYELGHEGLQVSATGRERGQRLFDEGYGVRMGDITFMLPPNDELYSASYYELLSDAVEFSGVLVSPPSRILAWKEGVNHAKDAADIELINAYLQNQAVEA